MLRDAANNNLCKVRSQGNRSACCASVSSDRASILSTTSVSPRLRSTPVQLIAAQFDGTEALLCAVVQIVECETDGKCHPATTEGARIPRFLKVNFDKKTITATEESGITDVSAIKNIEHSDDRLIMQGAENGRGWTLVISEKTGEMSATVSDDKVGFVVFGACTKD